MLDYEDFYYELDFNINQRVLGTFHMKQGDTKSRGFKVRVLHRGQELDIAGQSLNAYLVKPDGENITLTGRKAGNEFLVDIPVEALDTYGKIAGELILLGTEGERIYDYIFNISVEKSISYGM